MLLDDVMPRHDVNEVHSLVIRAGVPEVYEAVRNVTPGEMPLVGLLLELRALPARLLRRGTGFGLAPERPIMEQALRGGFVLLGETFGKEIVLGTVGVFWSLRGGPSPVIADAQEFVRFDRLGYAKAAMNFLLEPLGGSAVKLRTETRIQAPDAASLARFRRYWRVIHPGTALIRRLWLRAIKRRAERLRQAV